MGILLKVVLFVLAMVAIVITCVILAAVFRVGLRAYYDEKRHHLGQLLKLMTEADHAVPPPVDRGSDSKTTLH
jgi:hypothetical protein